MIGVQYSCLGCGLKDAPVDVPARSPGEIVTAWLDAARVYITADHHRRSPLCNSETFDLKIPLTPGSDRIGEATRQ